MDLLALPLSVSTHLLLSCDLHKKMTHAVVMTCLKCCVAHNLSYIANTQKLSADWQSTHYLLNLSACVILSDAFAPKKSLLTVTAVSAAIFLQEEKNENQFSGRQCFDNISLTTLLRIPSKFQSLSMILKMTWIYFSLKRRSVS